MTQHLDLHVSCLCGGVLQDINRVSEPPYRQLILLRCESCLGEMGVEARLFWIGRPPGRKQLGWGEFGSGERARDVRRAVA
jgi:hypothetical protein